ncbi:signal peptidase complex-like protein [Thermochaetoides thermophila DSM 1495]|uniref:Signal peptidase complex subunit 2 n=1 Tax=Chaetomium thermophilum (strain DSM 1495 / CBS 144.50 / IMI 039719) TaxID=759272 RepID=G0S091_CHATD|nr:signal peptidase complex-like protein [Thermochaetoides thermophila DSM 1495]EGS23252.1 signal peptidase complex-like protein [Thermochaetoides thermophila DSM 1495]
MANSQDKINVYNLADLKNNSDDAIPNYLNSLGFRQSHRLIDVRLALGYSAFAVAAACFVWDHKYGFEATKYLTAVAVAVYTLLNGALTAWIMWVERGTVYVGEAPQTRETIRISTATKKNVPTYFVTVEITPKDGKGKKQTIEISRPFAEWFDAAGRFVAVPFQTMLATAVPVIGKSDPKRVATSAQGPGETSSTPAYTPQMLDLLAKASGSASGVTAEAVTGTDVKTGGKRRKA